MVLKLVFRIKLYDPRFENDVNQYGTQTGCYICLQVNKFENDVNQYGTQTLFRVRDVHTSLRMM